MTLLGEIGRLANDIIATVIDSRDESRALLIGDELHVVAHRNGVCTAYALQSEVALYLALDDRPVISLYGIPATGVLDY